MKDSRSSQAGTESFCSCRISRIDEAIMLGDGKPEVGGKEVKYPEEQPRV